MSDLAAGLPPSTNRLLRAFPGAVHAALRPHLEPVALGVRQLLYEPHVPIPYVYFPTSGVISLVTVMADGTVVEVATVGKEGMVGLPVFLGVETLPGQAFCQVPGQALRIPTGIFRGFAQQSGALQQVIHRYTAALFIQMAQAAACTRVHPLAQRCASRLLMTHDRVDGDQFDLTQELLAQMLGVRRASVNAVASRLQKVGWIRYRRGRITILGRAELEGAACGCYRIIQEEYDRLLN